MRNNHNKKLIMSFVCQLTSHQWSPQIMSNTCWYMKSPFLVSLFFLEAFHGPISSSSQPITGWSIPYRLQTIGLADIWGLDLCITWEKDLRAYGRTEVTSLKKQSWRWPWRDRSKEPTLFINCRWGNGVLSPTGVVASLETGDSS